MLGRPVTPSAYDEAVDAIVDAFDKDANLQILAHFAIAADAAGNEPRALAETFSRVESAIERWSAAWDGIAQARGITPRDAIGKALDASPPDTLDARGEKASTALWLSPFLGRGLALAAPGAADLDRVVLREIGREVATGLAASFARAGNRRKLAAEEWRFRVEHRFEIKGEDGRSAPALRLNRAQGERAGRPTAEQTEHVKSSVRSALQDEARALRLLRPAAWAFAAVRGREHGRMRWVPWPEDAVEVGAARRGPREESPLVTPAWLGWPWCCEAGRQSLLAEAHAPANATKREFLSSEWMRLAGTEWTRVAPPRALVPLGAIAERWMEAWLLAGDEREEAALAVEPVRDAPDLVFPSLLVGMRDRDLEFAEGTFLWLERRPPADVDARIHRAAALMLESIFGSQGPERWRQVRRNVDDLPPETWASPAGAPVRELGYGELGLPIDATLAGTAPSFETLPGGHAPGATGCAGGTVVIYGVFVGETRTLEDHACRPRAPRGAPSATASGRVGGSLPLCGNPSRLARTLVPGIAHARRVRIWWRRSG